MYLISYLTRLSNVMKGKGKGKLAQDVDVLTYGTDMETRPIVFLTHIWHVEAKGLEQSKIHCKADLLNPNISDSGDFSSMGQITGISNS